MIHHRKKKNTLLTLGLCSLNVDKSTSWCHHPRADVATNFWQVEGADKQINKCRVSRQE